MNPQHCPVDGIATNDKLFSNVYIEKPHQHASDKIKHMFFVDSRDIEKSDDFQYSIIISDPYKNVHSIELKGISFPKIADENYVILEIDECKDRLDSIDGSVVQRSFCVCYFDLLNTGDIRPLRGSDFDRKLYVFNPVVSKLGKLNIRFRKHDGSIVSSSDVNGIVKHTLLFEITTCQ
jgi:hypothetical protein